MRVKELIKILKTWDNEMGVAISDEDGENTREIISVHSYNLPGSDKLILVIS